MKQGILCLSMKLILGHWFVIKYHEHKYKSQVSESNRVSQQPSLIFRRNSGPCNAEVLPQFWGLGYETRGTSTKVPDPLGIETGKPEEIPYPYEEKWLLNVMVIDTRGVEDRVGCLDFRCDPYNDTTDLYGQPLKPDYKGGLLCCYDNTQCRVRNGFERPWRSLYLRYTVKWVDWDQFQVPVNVYILDVTDNMEISKNSKVTGPTHNCLVEYDIQSKVGSSCPDFKKGIDPNGNGWLCCLCRCSSAFRWSWFNSAWTGDVQNVTLLLSYPGH